MAQPFFGGIHPNDKKAATNKKPIEKLPPPQQVVIPMSLHIGAPCRPSVSVGDHVNLGQRIGEATAFVSAPIHASISGTVTAIEPRPHFNGTDMLSVVIENDYEDTLDPSIKPAEHPEDLTAEELTEIVKNAGIVGLGGATFPTHVKISSGLGKVDTVIVNAAECEPYNTSDHRILLEYPEEVIGGARLLARLFQVDKVHIGIEDNKRNAAQLLQQRIAEENAPVVVDVLHTRYPQGAEKQLCQSITGRQVPPGGLPAAIGCAVFSVDTTAAIWRAVYQGMPVIRRIVTVSGSGVMEPKNLECRIGTPLSCLFDACGGLSETTYKILMGGPMMGNAQPAHRRRAGGQMHQRGAGLCPGGGAHLPPPHLHPLRPLCRCVPHAPPAGLSLSVRPAGYAPGAGGGPCDGLHRVRRLHLHLPGPAPPGPRVSNGETKDQYRPGRGQGRPAGQGGWKGGMSRDRLQ